MTENRNWRQRLRKWLFWKTDHYNDWVYKNSKPDWAYAPDWIAVVFCSVLFSHNAIPDHCGKPDHDYCAWCMKSMPNQAATNKQWQ